MTCLSNIDIKSDDGTQSISQPSDSNSIMSAMQLDVTSTSSLPSSSSTLNLPSLRCRSHRDKRDRRNEFRMSKHAEAKIQTSAPVYILKKKKKMISALAQKHENDSSSGGIGSIIPSLIGVLALSVILVARSGFRGRSTVAGIDLGTTNSVICVQQQANAEGVGKIECIPDPFNLSPVIPSVVSFLDHPKSTSLARNQDAKKINTDIHLYPDPEYVLVGMAAKKRIDSHPHQTLYHAKRVLGRRFNDTAVHILQDEVEFSIRPSEDQFHLEEGVTFEVPFYVTSAETKIHSRQQILRISPQQVGSYVVNHLMTITRKYLGHDNIKSAVIAVPAKFDAIQREATVQAFRSVGIKVARILEEPVAAALAYGLEKKENVDYIMVYDFGGGTLDVSILQVSKDGYVEVMGSDGDDNLGGADFDAAVAHFLLDGENGKRNELAKVASAFESLRAAIPIEDWKNNSDGLIATNIELEEILFSKCPRLSGVPLCTLSSFHTIAEHIKIDLSSFVDGVGSVTRHCLGFPSVDNTIPRSFTEIDDFCGSLGPVQLTLSSDQYNAACQSLYERSMFPIRRLFSDLQISAADVDEVVMVGGTTRMPKIRQLVRDELNISSLNTHIDPDLTVAVGAASVID